MDQNLLNSMKGMSREERLEYFKAHKTELMDSQLAAVNGGARASSHKGENPNSDVPYNGNWISSYGFVCHGEVIC